MKAVVFHGIGDMGYFGAKLAEVKSGGTVAVFGCGPVSGRLSQDAAGGRIASPN